MRDGSVVGGDRGTSLCSFFFRVGPVWWVALDRDNKVIRMGGFRIAILEPLKGG